MSKEQATDSLMARVRALFLASGMTFEQLGRAMGYEGEVARKSAWQFVDRTNDPRLSMLRRFAKAVGLTLEELVAGTSGSQGASHREVNRGETESGKETIRSGSEGSRNTQAPTGRRKGRAYTQASASGRESGVDPQAPRRRPQGR